jgi:hypothetical protein
MRPDMKKKFVERHKHKHTGTKGNKGKAVKLKLIPGADPEDLPSQPTRSGHTEKGLRIWKEDRNYSWVPLRRFLESRLGVQWDLVWSEICVDADGRSGLGWHFREQFRWMVQKSLDDVDNNMRDFYVDRNGALRSRRKSWHHYQRHDVSKIVRVDDKLYHEHDGIWYQVRMEPVKSSYRGGRWSIDLPELKDEFLGVLGGNWFNLVHNEYGESRGSMNICVWKKSANKKEIKAVRKALEEAS